MRRFLALTFLGVAAMLPGAPALAQQAAPAQAAPAQIERIAAVVNEEVITFHDLEMRYRITVMSAGLQDGLEMRKRLLPQVLRKLIDERLQIQEADRQKIAVSDADIAQGVEMVEKQNQMPPGSFLKMLEGRGIDPATVRQQIKAEIAWIRLVRRNAGPSFKVTDEEIDAKLETIKAAMGKPEYLASEIFLAVDDPAREDEIRRLGDKLLDDLRSGTPFPGLARQFSQSPTATNGGDMGWIATDSQDPEIEQALNQLQPGQVSSLIRTTNGFTILALRDRRIAGEIRRNAAPQQPQAPTQAAAPVITYDLAQILVPVSENAPAAEKAAAAQKAESFGRRLKTCDDTEKLGKQLSPLSGRLGELKSTDLPPQLRAVVLPVKVNQVSKPAEIPDGMVVLMVCKRSESKAPALTAAPPPAPVASGPATMAPLPKREDIQRKLEDQRMDMVSRRLLRDVRRAAFVDVRI